MTWPASPIVGRTSVAIAQGRAYLASVPDHLLWDVSTGLEIQPPAGFARAQGVRLLASDDGAVHLLWILSELMDSDVWHAVYRDGTWSSPLRVVRAAPSPQWVLDSTIVLRDGRILLPVGTAGGILVLSDGTSTRVHRPGFDFDVVLELVPMATEDGDLRAIATGTSPDGRRVRVETAFSFDAGETWRHTGTLASYPAGRVNVNYPSLVSTPAGLEAYWGISYSSSGWPTEALRARLPHGSTTWDAPETVAEADAIFVEIRPVTDACGGPRLFVTEPAQELGTVRGIALPTNGTAAAPELRLDYGSVVATEVVGDTLFALTILATPQADPPRVRFARFASFTSPRGETAHPLNRR